MNYIIGRDAAYSRLRELSSEVEENDRVCRFSKEKLLRAILEIRDTKWVDETSEELVEGLWRTEGETFSTFEQWLDGMEAQAGVSMAGSTAWDKTKIVRDLEAMFPDMERDVSIRLAVHHQGATKQVVDHFRELPQESQENPSGLFDEILSQPNGKRSKQHVDSLLGKAGKLWFSFVKGVHTASMAFETADRHIAIEAVYSDTPYQFALLFEKDAPEEAIRAVAQRISKKAEV